MKQKSRLGMEKKKIKKKNGIGRAAFRSADGGLS